MTSQTSTASYMPLLREATSAAFKGRSPKALWLKSRMFAAGIRHREALARMQNAPSDSALRRALDGRPQMLGLLLWPYQCASWDTAKRLERFQAHYAEIDKIGGPIRFELDEKLFPFGGDIHTLTFLLLSTRSTLEMKRFPCWKSGEPNTRKTTPC